MNTQNPGLQSPEACSDEFIDTFLVPHIINCIPFLDKRNDRNEGFKSPIKLLVDQQNWSLLKKIIVKLNKANLDEKQWGMLGGYDYGDALYKTLLAAQTAIKNNQKETAEEILDLALLLINEYTYAHHIGSFIHSYAHFGS